MTKQQEQLDKLYDKVPKEHKKLVGQIVKLEIELESITPIYSYLKCDQCKQKFDSLKEFDKHTERKTNNCKSATIR